MGGALGLALALSALRAEAVPSGDAPRLTLDLRPCSAVDEAAVRDLIELELSETRAVRPDGPIAVTVRCVRGAEEIRVLPRSSPSDNASRTIALSAPSEGGPATQQARSRELALAIAELIRRSEITRSPGNEQRSAPTPLAPTMPGDPPPPTATSAPSPASVLATSAPSAEAPAQTIDDAHATWQLGVQSAFEAFAGGQRLAGADVSVGLRFRRWLLGEFLVGGRLGDAERLPSGQPAFRAATASAGAGLDLTSPRHAVGGALMLRAHAYAVEYTLAHPDGSAQSAWLAALFVDLEPRLVVSVARHVSLMAAVGAGFPVRGIVVRTQGQRTDSLSGLSLSARLGALLAF